ncbi:hypothetical protein [Sphingomonas gei]|uniref:hypothetical protein n=1 Tax=Sphingomonas gei TaxID=1395960 RepID=UPI0014417474|nr:hypothetical protein [Sphingomonas gei]
MATNAALDDVGSRIAASFIAISSGTNNEALAKLGYRPGPISYSSDNGTNKMHLKLLKI